MFISVILSKLDGRLLCTVQSNNKTANVSISLCPLVGAFISAFSVPKNWYRLRSTTSNPDHRKLRSIQGMRFYTIMCVVAIHTIMNHLGGPVANPRYTENVSADFLRSLAGAFIFNKAL